MKSVLEQLPNIGPKVAEQLEEIGVRTPEDLAQMGAKEAWLRILAIDSSACINRLMGLEGAARGIPKKLLSQEVRDDLKAFYKQAKG